MSEKRISLGINVSILVILTIFGVLLSLPLRLLLNTNYGRNQTICENNTIEATENLTSIEPIVPLDHRRLKRCPKLPYEDRLKSVFRCDYDGNCTYVSLAKDDLKEINKQKTIEEGEITSKVSKEVIDENLSDNTEESVKDHRMKSVPVAGHILVTMLLISAIAALVEVLRIRFARDKAGSASSRKTSTVELPVQRRFIPRQPIRSQRSFEIQGMHRSALRLLGAKPPPLIRRSSFPTQPSKQNSASFSGTPNNWISRRQSAESDEEIGLLISALHHRTRLIRRH
ncbi:uncharacterized protein LOC114875912 isoform X2 [Osmia bicornis bicornis]|uniref:uncharacterized protein LOC114875912 isoform X2 n=1 Tax=Osmia bicornis bicornis TaxID=1437191 RepID=UPI0010F4AD0E|nr:uncharacterized protein LOC114875912 isoform X2 [Osmia bicornis bicornis]